MGIRTIFILILLLPSTVSAQAHVEGYGGLLGRVQAQSFDLTNFKSGPKSNDTATFGLGGGKSIWKLSAGGTLLYSQTGQTQIVIGPSRRITTTTKGHALLFDVGADWPLLRIYRFRVGPRVGYGAARVRIATLVPIEDDRRFWTYGVVASRPLYKKLDLRIDVRNVHFRQDEIPETLGRYNVVALGGVNFRF